MLRYFCNIIHRIGNLTNSNVIYDIPGRIACYRSDNDIHSACIYGTATDDTLIDSQGAVINAAGTFDDISIAYINSGIYG